MESDWKEIKLLKKDRTGRNEERVLCKSSIPVGSDAKNMKFAKKQKQSVDRYL